MRMLVAVGCALFAFLAFGAPRGLAAQETHTVSGTVRDSASGVAVSGAAVDLAGGSFGRGVRSDENGAFTFTRVPDGDYQLFVRQIGFVGAHLAFHVAADTTLALVLVGIARRLDTVRTRAAVTGISGVVGTARDLRPIAGAKVQVIGAEHDAVTDSLGRFFVDLKKANAYTMRVSRSGYGPEVRSVEVDGDEVVETATLLDSSLRQPGLALDDIRVEDVASVELYGPGDEATGTLRWPPNSRCGENTGVHPLHGVGNSSTAAVLAAVWLK